MDWKLCLLSSTNVVSSFNLDSNFLLFGKFESYNSWQGEKMSLYDNNLIFFFENQ